MSLLLAAALSVSGAVVPHCSWDRPGANPFMGDVVAAVDRYRDIPDSVRATLKQRIAARQYDEVATIRRDEVVGAYRYADLRDMHFGGGTICRSVTRTRWKDGIEERGLVYCEAGHCIIVPTVCRNVSRITRVPMRSGQSETAVGPPAPTPEITFMAGSDSELGELQFEPPAAGSGRSFASGLSDAPSALPSGSASGLVYGSGEPATGSDSHSWAGLVVPPTIGVPPPTVLGPGLPMAGLPTPSADEPLGLPGVPPVIGVTPIPEPSTYVLLALGVGLVASVGWRRANTCR